MKKILSIISCLFPLLLFGQVQDNITKEGNYTVTGTETLTATNSITLKPNTWIKSGSNFTAKIISDPYSPLQLSNENYVLSRTFQTASQTGVVAKKKDVIESITYYDGLGRAKQNIGISQSPTHKDIVTHIEYDGLGRQVKEYLPYATATNNGGIITGDVATATKSYYQTAYATDFAGVNLPDINAFSEKEFDNSPLNRILKQAAPGKDWKLGRGHEIKFEYGTNTTSEVKIFGVSTNFANNTYTPTLTGGSSFYSTGELYKTITKDENWSSGLDHTTEEFKNKQGQVILKRTYNNNNVAHDTYYVYDDFGNLTYVLPPKSEAQLVKPNATSLSELCYQYKYDHRNRLIEKKIPGKGWEYIVYDKLDRPIMTQDANLKAQNKWLFTKYDKLGRVVYTGEYYNGSTRTRKSIQNIVNGFSEDKLYENRTGLNTISGIPVHYTYHSFPNTNQVTIHTVNYYDDYGFEKSGAPNNVVSYTVSSTTRLKGLATGSLVRVLDTNNWITTVTYYDEKARPIYVYTKNGTLGTIDIIENNLDFVGKVIARKSTHKKDGKSDIITIDRFEYDHRGRMTTQTQQINNQDVEAIVSNQYDELGQLKLKEVGDGLQKIDYTYNVRGWLKNINQDNLNDNDLFNFSLKYNDSTTGNALFNGNISQASWNTLSTNNTSNPVSNHYTYSYDALNRITTALDNTGEYSLGNITPIGYDKNGNIGNMQRKRVIDADDNFTYSYSGNQLQSLSGTTSGAFSYDANGNMITDTRKNITNITYNHLNLPTQVTIGGKHIKYTYDASGVKLKKVVDDSTTTEYAGNHIYENNTLQFFNHPEGYVTPKNASDIAQGFNYVYQYKDHNGSVRLSYSDANNDGIITPSTEILDEKNYYPFGLEHKGYNSNVIGAVNNFETFNGKELDESLGLNVIEMDWRQYDPAIGRFNVIDPVTHWSKSTYNAFDNNPVYFMDPSGADSGTMRLQGLDGKWHTLTEGKDYTTVYSASDSNDEDEEDGDDTSNNVNNVFKDPLSPENNVVTDPKDDIKKFERNQSILYRNSIILDVLSRLTNRGQVQATIEKVVEEWREMGEIITPKQEQSMIEKVDDGLNALGVTITTAAPQVKIAATIISTPLAIQSFYLDMQNENVLKPRIKEHSPSEYTRLTGLKVYTPHTGGSFGGGGASGSWKN